MQTQSSICDCELQRVKVTSLLFYEKLKRTKVEKDLCKQNKQMSAFFSQDLWSIITVMNVK